MSFYSLGFIFLFLPATIATYFSFHKKVSVDAAKAALVGASLFFYGCWNWAYVPTLLASIAVNYSISCRLRAQPRTRSRRLWLLGGIILNLAVLGFFKYANFFIASAGLFAGSAAPHIILPLGLSFFTLQQIAFLMDTHERIAEEKSFLNYSLFVSFFPYITSGPITHHEEIVPQLEKPEAWTINYENLARGLFIFSIGFFKKVMIAANLDMLSFHNAHAILSFVDAWYASLFYTLQLYFDFSGYSDMAIGLGLMFNIALPINFNSPLKATNIVEFWRRWHITLANFMRTYVFTAIMRAQKEATFGISLVASFFTMVLLGIWHGAGWNYLLFGVMHGLAMIVFNIWAKFKIRMPKVFAWALLVGFIDLSLVAVHANYIGEALGVMQGMAGLNSFAPVLFGGDIVAFGSLTTILLGLLIVVTSAKNSIEMMREFRPNAEYLLFTLFLFLTPVLNLSHVHEFIYFQF